MYTLRKSYDRANFSNKLFCRFYQRNYILLSPIEKVIIISRVTHVLQTRDKSRIVSVKRTIQNKFFAQHTNNSSM